ncbi:hypothetical protein FSP39_002261 [Pinctada imbricata]|uniref:MULE transposase domain-containing protein n=1 Tax=Pinctada imbricata TaxID=66713 RepID=A0AA88XH41_PINIB|nr:hypothetical protein FSP39_002261 [Pinctada imbricata]
MYRARRKTTPALHKTQSSITLDGKWTETATGDRFLLIDGSHHSQRTIVFATDNNLRELAAADTIYCDRTFYTCPTLFHQIYTTHVRVDNVMTPVVFAFLPGKSQAIHTRFFDQLHIKMLDRGLTFNPKAAIVSGDEPWQPDFDYIGTTGSHTATHPLDAIEDVWFQALEDRDEANITDLTDPFTDYVFDQWIEGDRLLWNHFGTQGPRTTNNMEGWHSKLKKMVQHANPNIYTAIQMIKDVENANEITCTQRAAGGTIRPKCKKYLNIDRRLVALKDRYQQGSIDLMEHADSASELLHIG